MPALTRSFANLALVAILVGSQTGSAISEVSRWRRRAVSSTKIDGSRCCSIFFSLPRLPCSEACAQEVRLH